MKDCSLNLCFRWWGSLLPGLYTLDPLLGPPLIPCKQWPLNKSSWLKKNLYQKKRERIDNPIAKSAMAAPLFLVAKAGSFGRVASADSFCQQSSEWQHSCIYCLIFICDPFAKHMFSYPINSVHYFPDAPRAVSMFHSNQNNLNAWLNILSTHRDCRTSRHRQC